MSDHLAGLPTPPVNPFAGDMTLRDYFAACIVGGYVAQHHILEDANSEEMARLCFLNAAAFSYRLADAMIAERAKP